MSIVDPAKKSPPTHLAGLWKTFKSILEDMQGQDRPADQERVFGIMLELMNKCEAGDIAYRQHVALHEERGLGWYSGEEFLRISGVSHPGVMRAVNDMRMDNGGPQLPPYMPDMEYRIPLGWALHIEKIEDFLAGLRGDSAAPEDSEFLASREPDAAESLHVASYVNSEAFSFVAGEAEVIEAMTKRSPEAMMANMFLNSLFEGWAWLSYEEAMKTVKTEEPA